MRVDEHVVAGHRRGCRDLGEVGGLAGLQDEVADERGRWSADADQCVVHAEGLQVETVLLVEQLDPDAPLGDVVHRLLGSLPTGSRRRELARQGVVGCKVRGGHSDPFRSCLVNLWAQGHKHSILQQNKSIKSIGAD